MQTLFDKNILETVYVRAEKAREEDQTQPCSFTSSASIPKPYW